MARENDKISNQTKILDDDFDYEKEMAEIEEQERELEARRKQKKEERARRLQKEEEQNKRDKSADVKVDESEKKASIVERANNRQKAREQKKEAEWLGEAFDQNADTPQPRRKKSKKGIIALVIILLLLIGAGGAYFYKMQADQKIVADFEAKVAAFQTEKLDDAQLGDKADYFNGFIDQCREAIDNKDLAAISQLNSKWKSMEDELTEVTNGKMAIDSFVAGALETLKPYYITETYKEQYDALVKELNAAKDANQYDKISSLQKSVDALVKNLKADDLKEVQKLKNAISEMDLDANYLTDSQKEELKNLSDQTGQQLDKENYNDAVATLQKWKSSASAISESVTSRKAEEAARAESEAEELRRQRESEAAAAQAAREAEMLAQLQEEENSSSSSGSDGSYIFSDSSSRYLSKSELSGLSNEQLMYARNEIYARHGYIFRDANLKKYFESKSWYQGTVPSDSFSSTVFNQYEQANINLILSMED